MVLSNSLADGLCPHRPKGDGPRDDLLGPALPYEWTDSSPKGTRTWAGPPSPPSDSLVPHHPDRFFSTPPGRAVGHQGKPQPGLPAPLTGFSSPPIFPEGLLAFSSDMDGSRRKHRTRKLWSRDESGGRSEVGWGSREHDSCSHVARKRQLMQSESAPSPAH